MTRRKRQSALHRVLVALGSALALHVAFFGFLIFLSLFQWVNPSHRTRPPRSVNVRSISAGEWARNRGEALPAPAERTAQNKKQQRDPPKEAEKEQEKRKREKRPEGQVVDVSPGNNKESEDAQYLAERSNTAERESRAKEQSAFYRNAMPQRTHSEARKGEGKDDVEKLELAGNQGTGEDNRPPAANGKSELLVPKVTRQDSVALKTEPSEGPGAQIANRSEREEIVGNSNRLQLPTEGGETGSAGRLGQPGARNLMPSMAIIDKITGAAPNDHLRNVEEGEGTFLNTKEWKFASFFNRVKQSVAMHWSPGDQLMARDPTGQIYGGRDRYTLVQVTLNTRGMVKEIYVEKSSGLDFLDLEAVHSFERAQPFPNPPPGLMDEDQLVRFSFGFFLEMGSGARMRIFRQAN